MRDFVVGERTIVHVLNEALRSCPDKAWLDGEMGRFTFRDIDALSNRIANGLRDAGLREGDRLLVMLCDCVEMIAIWVACAKTGIIDVPVNIAYRGDILAHIVTDCDAHIAIIESAFIDRFEAISDNIGSVDRYFIANSISDGPPLVAGRRASILDDLLATDTALDANLPNEWDTMSIMYTSGTTGGSKGVMVTHAHGFEYGLGCGTGLEICAEDIYYTAGLPLFHVAGRWGVIFASAIFGATAVVPRQFSVRNFWSEVRSYDVTAVYLLGVMANLLQRQPQDPRDADNPLQKVLMCPLLSDCADFATRFDLRIASAYGSTEVGAPVFMPLGTPVQDNQIVGKLRADKYEIMIADENDNHVAVGQLGEILLRPRQPWIAMLGYWKQPAKTAAMWRNLWLHSGDAGRFDADDNIYFVDRIQDTIRRRGENISSMEVEGILSQHHAIAECAVFPVRSEHTESEVMCAIVLKQGVAADAVDIIRFSEHRMAYFMVPRFIDFVVELPKTPTGKVRKNALREKGVTSSTWDRDLSDVKLVR